MQSAICRCQRVAVSSIPRQSIKTFSHSSNAATRQLLLKNNKSSTQAAFLQQRSLTTSSRWSDAQNGPEKPMIPPTTPSSDTTTSDKPSAATSKLYTERQRTGGPFSWKAAAVFLATGTALYFYFQNEKKKIQDKKKQETAAQKVGRPKIGGPFKLTTQYGKEFTDKDLLGKFSLVYFGFTNCPDICPEELDKMTVVVDKILASHGKDSILPVFITCDPARDTIPAIKAYCDDFHPNLIGLTGSYDDIKKCCKTYRVYFSTPPDAKASDDYLVDHSIFFYLMDPQGGFIDAFGRSATVDEVTGKVDNYMKEWKAGKRFSADEE